MKEDKWAELVGVEPDCYDCAHFNHNECSLEKQGLECDFEGVMVVFNEKEEK